MISKDKYHTRVDTQPGTVLNEVIKYCLSSAVVEITELGPLERPHLSPYPLLLLETVTVGLRVGLVTKNWTRHRTSETRLPSILVREFFYVCVTSRYRLKLGVHSLGTGFGGCSGPNPDRT